jgi:transposase-like protein
MKSSRTTETEREHTWLTITEIARRLDARESTVRSWRDRYPDTDPS